MKVDDIPVASLEIPVSLHIEGKVLTLFYCKHCL